MENSCRHKKTPWGQNMRTILTKQRGSNSVFKTFCFGDLYFFFGERTEDKAVRFPNRRQNRRFLGVRRREMKTKLSTFCRRHFVDK